jgi:drug/metabolite transporter (DMT)-like permease
MEAAVTREQAKQTTIGAMLIGIGVLLLANQFEWGPVWNLHRLWPVILIVLGVPILVFGDKDGSHGGGVWLTITGTVMLLHTLRIMSVRQSWPLFIVAVGAAMFLDSLTKRAPQSKKEV